MRELLGKTRAVASVAAVQPRRATKRDVPTLGNQQMQSALRERIAAHPRTSRGDEVERAADRTAEAWMNGAAAPTASPSRGSSSAAQTAPVSGGRPLDAVTRARFEPLARRDLSDVRVHDGGDAAGAAQWMHARAFTLGNAIFFAPGEHRPESDRGQRLLAHEIAHVVQADALPRPMVMRAPDDDQVCSAESEEICPAPAASSNVSPSADDAPQLANVRDLQTRIGELERRLARPRSYAGRDLDESLLAGYRAMLAGRIRGFDDALAASLPALQNQLETELVKKNTMQQQAHVVSLEISEGTGQDYTAIRLVRAKLSIRNVSYAIFPVVSTREQTVVLGGVYPTGDTESAAQYWSKMGVVESEGLGPIDWLLAAWGIIGALRFLARLAVRAIVARLAVAEGAEVGAGAGVLRGRFFARPTFSSVGNDPVNFPAGAGTTDKYGNVVVSSLGTQAEQDLVRFHESVHSFLSPKLLPLRDLRADFAIAAYQRSQLLRYLEEALAETYAQLRVNGMSGMLEGIRFPIASNAYSLSLSTIITEAAIGTVVVGGVSYGVYVVGKKAIDATLPSTAKP